MSKRLGYRFLIWMVLIWPRSSCLAQPATIRVIDVHNGRPLQKEKVSVAFLYEKGQRPPGEHQPNINGETDANGEMQIQIPEPEPAHVSVMVHVTSEYLVCGCWVLGDIKDLIQKGIVGPPPSAKLEKSDAAVKAVPGEVLVLARPMGFFERLFYPIMKE